ncbi:hypothetical protein EIN_055740 [Entamoeba invadens IP1]|uniref:hypothetical protein n=1 Tax=Entamoeba invadens IP1 TaxID=370355 RepID=UPI0002C3D8F4|nr:hypothetical protein EIN_055740 [Entamoeba invadens IP1]ELP93229.1 hypothetical protein EIN_055740 [Entamoeba invadens IP1]|eukprot:XP_004260000.1 hypothetical protein EIN_055740 [Entamoeba invadens IP1]
MEEQNDKERQLTMDEIVTAMYNDACYLDDRQLGKEKGELMSVCDQIEHAISSQAKIPQEKSHGDKLSQAEAELRRLKTQFENTQTNYTKTKLAYDRLQSEINIYKVTDTQKSSEVSNIRKLKIENNLLKEEQRSLYEEQVRYLYSHTK